MNSQPLEVERIVSDDAPRQPLAVELLLTETQRVTVEEHQAFRDSLNPQPEETEL